MNSPLASRLLLARALLDLREEAGHTHASLSKASKISTATISRLENPADHINRKPDLVIVRRLLDALGVDRKSDLWQDLDAWAEAGASRGWWDDPQHARMGSRQRIFAVVEAGAHAIFDYGNSLLPGPVQTESYARYRAQVGDGGPNVDVDAIVAGRMRRKKEIADSGVRYELVVEEIPIRRRACPAPVMIDQLRHLLDLGRRPNVSIRVLPVDADVANGSGAAPRAQFAHITYPAPGDPEIATVDTVTRDLLITDVGEVQGYARLHERLRKAALSDADSAALIREAAEKLAADM